LRRNLTQATDLLQKKLWQSYREKDGTWCGHQWMNISLTAEYLLLLKYLDLEDSEAKRVLPAIRKIESCQNKDGGFSAYHGGASNDSLTVICQLALDLYRHQVDPGVLEKVNDYVKEKVDFKNVLLLARFYRFLLGYSTIKGLPQIRPGLILWPKWTRISVYDVASWVRSWLIPIAILWHFEKYDPQRPDHSRLRFYLPFLRKKSIKKIENWLLDHQEEDGSWYGVFSSTMISLMALHRLGYNKEDARIKKGLAFIHSLQEEGPGTLRQQAFLGPIWDTAHALMALTEDREFNTNLFERSKAFLLENQVMERGDWSINNSCLPGGWSFEYINKNYPDVDDTALVLRSLSRLGMKKDHPQVKRGLDWLLSMQNRDGSWAAFDKNNLGKLPEWYMKLRGYYIGDGPGLMLDSGTPDLTAHALECLGNFGYTMQDIPVKKAMKYLLCHQEKDASWFGRWGLCYLYGTSSVLRALAAVGEDMEKEYIRKAVGFLRAHQNEDGGFGEEPEAYFDPQKRGKGPSDPTQSAWVVLGLLAAGERTSNSVASAVDYLTRTLGNKGEYSTSYFHAVAAPPLYQRYELYPVYFPLLALKKFESLQD
jgi:squalene-hopene/tetraprenyl-beta-curcumene cyclase